MKASWKKNLEVRENHDWLKIKGATSQNADFETLIVGDE
jgi:hypothetical protein